METSYAIAVITIADDRRRITTIWKPGFNSNQTIFIDIFEHPKRIYIFTNRDIGSVAGV